MLLLLFLMTGLYLLIPAVIAQIFNPTTKPAMPTGAPTSETNAEIEIQLLAAETKSRKMFKVI